MKVISRLKSQVMRIKNMKEDNLMKAIRFISIAALTVLYGTTAFADDFSLTSTNITEGIQLDTQQVFQGFGCDGGNISPALTWKNAPEGTKSFALTAYDPDAPTGSGWWHWFAFNIPVDTTSIEAGAALPANSIELSNDYGTVGFGGACPPAGEVHRYQFTIHALPTVLEIDSSVSNALAGFMVNANSIASDTITAVYSR